MIQPSYPWHKQYFCKFRFPRRFALRTIVGLALLLTCGARAADDAARRRDALIADNLRAPMADFTRQPANDAVVSRIIKYQSDPMIARIVFGESEAREAALGNLTHLMAVSGNTMFTPWTFTEPLIAFLPVWETISLADKETLRRMLANWNYDCSAGTINMRLYLCVAGYLASQYFPGFADSATPPDPAYAADYRHKQLRAHTAAEIQTLCRDQIYRIFDHFARDNGFEHSKVYLTCDLVPVKMLVELARDEAMRERARMVMDCGLLNLATDWNQGYAVEPTFREKLFPLGGAAVNATDGVGGFYFGMPAGRPAAHVSMVYALTNYAMPTVFGAIAADRGGVRIKRERSVMESGGSTTFKTFFHAPGYTLTSGVNDYTGGIRTATFKEQRLVRLTWLCGRPGNSFHVFQENIGQPYFGKTDPNPFGVGENPYSQCLQSGRTIIGLYAVPSDYPLYRQYTVYACSDAVQARLEKKGWTFCHGGTMLFGFYSTAPITWERQVRRPDVAYPFDVRWCASRTNAWVLETADVAAYSGATPARQLEQFADQVLSAGVCDTADMTRALPAFGYRSIHGDEMRILFKPLEVPLADRHRINGEAVDYARWKQLDSPWATQEAGSPVLQVRFAGVSRNYDFARWQVSTSVAPDAGP